MELKPNCGSDRAWLWSVAADYADEEAKPETLAIRFANAESKLKYDMGDRYRVKAVLNVETDIIASIAVSPTGRAGILAIMYVKH